MLHPILVSGGGRSGTTLLMQLLGSSPLVAFDRVPPFEHRYLTFLVRLSGLVVPGEPIEGWNRTAVAARKTPLLGPIPWDRAEALGDDPAEFRREAFLALWERFSAAPGHPEGATHYAEKTPPWLSGELEGLLPFAGLMPVRDPRDVLLSIAAFVEKRGRPGFGMKPGEDPAQFAERFIPNQRARLRQAARAGRTGTAIVVRYEDLITDLPGQSDRIGSLLGIDLDPGAVGAAEQYHTTAASPEVSVRRWEREMPAALQQVFAAALGEEMAALGYDL
jgi:hypothetical protein